MQQTISITRQWQIYLPEEIREKIKLDKPVKANIRVEKGKIIIKPLKSKALSLAGILKGKKPIKKLKIGKIRDYIDYWQW